MTGVFVSWSGGKDCCLACHRAIRSGLKVSYLANTVTQDGLRSCSHGIRADVIEAQAQAMGIPIVQQRTSTDNYEVQFKKMAAALKEKGVTGGVFGDIDFEPHREWVERVCSEAGIKSYLPLWGEDQKKLVNEFIALGFEAVVVATQADLLGEEWLGRKLDREFIRHLETFKQITPCGEAGEYHTLVIDGPLSNKRLEIKESSKVFRDGHWFLEITDVQLVPKK